uniref:Uncharacterized protein n=2 Tax=Tetraselmis sp. GSL018 TaxID=582737 RepID=A0A061S814_9CHLO
MPQSQFALQVLLGPLQQVGLFPRATKTVLR